MNKEDAIEKLIWIMHRKFPHIPTYFRENIEDILKYRMNIKWVNEAKVETYSNGYYIGTFSNGQRSGYGAYLFNEGQIQMGDWANGELSNEGYIFYENGSIFHGMFENGSKEGKGHLWDPNGSGFEGHYKNNQAYSDLYGNVPKTKIPYAETKGGSGCFKKGCRYIVIGYALLFILPLLFALLLKLLSFLYESLLQ